MVTVSTRAPHSGRAPTRAAARSTVPPTQRANHFFFLALIFCLMQPLPGHAQLPSGHRHMRPACAGGAPWDALREPPPGWAACAPNESRAAATAAARIMGRFIVSLRCFVPPSVGHAAVSEVHGASLVHDGKILGGATGRGVNGVARLPLVPAEAGDPVAPALASVHRLDAAEYWMARFRGP
jgi:hypothetical protein